MTNLIPKWVMLAYSSLFKEFQDKQFTTEEAKKILNEKTAIILHRLNKAGWIEFVGVDTKDQRKRYYKLKNPQEAIVELVEDNNHGSRRDIKHKKTKR
jgi:DNA-binding PadR family transcriptional regulator